MVHDSKIPMATEYSMSTTGNRRPDRPRTASPKKARTVPEDIHTGQTLKTVNEKNSESSKKGPKKRKQADRLQAADITMIAEVQQTPILEKPIGKQRCPSPTNESSERYDTPKPSPVNLKRPLHRSRSPERTETEPEPPPERHTKYFHEAMSPTRIKSDFKSFNKLEPVMEEPTPKKRKRNKKKGVQNKEVPLQKPSLRKSDDSTDKKNRHVTVISSTNLERGPLVTSHSSKYPVLSDEGLLRKLLGVAMTNNQKGRIRQVLKEVFKGTDPDILPDVIHNKIQSILKGSANLTDTDLRKIRVLYNMLKLATETQAHSNEVIEQPAIPEKKSKKIVNEPSESVVKGSSGEHREDEVKTKGPKRYVVFVGNLPPDVNKDMILDHFSDLRSFIKDVRIPARGEDKKSAIAYVELLNKPTYEMALSRHHSMLANKRINVLYTTQQKTKISMSDAKGKRAKLVAMVKSGQLTGSVPLKRKRSQRRAKMRQARKLAEAQ